ncbi:hypothetical protein [Funiculus sociatus]
MPARRLSPTGDAQSGYVSQRKNSPSCLARSPLSINPNQRSTHTL